MNNSIIKKNQNLFFTIIIFLLIISSILLLLDIKWSAIFLIIIALFLSSVLIYFRNSQFFSMTLIFLAFSAAYGLLGPINFMLGGTYNEVFNSGNLAENVHIYLFAYCISLIGFMVGWFLFKNNNIQEKDEAKINFFIKNFNLILILLYISSFLTLSFEIINILRIGGFEMLFIGKAKFQELISNLSLTLPSDFTFLAYGLFLGCNVGLSKQQNNIKNNLLKILPTIVMILPFIMFKLLLGQRGALLSVVFCFLASFTLIIPIKKISFKLIFFGLLLYLFMVFAYTNRGITSLLIKNPDEYFSLILDYKRYIKYLNVGSGEFSCAFGNFCMFYEKYKLNFDFKYGLTYLEGLFIVIPSFLYIGVKPKSLTYLFRDEFVSSWGDRSRIASTAFSSILEAYMNFGFIGIFLFYLIIGIIIQKIDFSRNNSNSIFKCLILSMIINNVIIFSRTQFGDIFSGIVYNTVLLCLLFLISTIIYKCFYYDKLNKVEVKNGN